MQFLEIEARLKAKQDSGQLAAMQKEVQERIKSLCLKFTAGWRFNEGNQRLWSLLWSKLYLTETIYDQDGQIIALPGTVVKPLEVAPDSIRKCFSFDGPRTWSNRSRPRNLQQNMVNHLCLFWLQADWDELSAEMDQAVYYDQQGRMSKSFQLSEVPSLVSQEGNRLHVEAMKPWKIFIPH